MMKMMGKAVCCLLLCAALLTGAARGETAVRGVNHRGYSAAAPENTLPAFALSWEMGFRYVETDVSFTKDNVAVLLHDAGLEMVALHDRPEGSALGSYHYVIEAECESGVTAAQLDAVLGAEGVRFAGCFDAVEKR